MREPVMIYTLYMWTLITGAVIVFGAVLALALPIAWRGPLYRLITGGWAKFIVLGAGVKLDCRGLEKLDPSKPYVFMSNHQSYFDVICLTAGVSQPLRFVAKKELVYIPVFGQLMWATRHIIIDRSRPERAVSEMQKAAQKIRGGISILVFPEGTRSPDHRLGLFKKGGFMLALQAKVPVVPVSISGTGPMMPKGRLSFKKSDVTITIGEPFPTNDLTTDDREELMDRTRAVIIRNFPQDSPEYQANKDDPSPEKFSL
jgi:1-acyl-sn-glycerol-3-phosphate acyltransferase